MSDYHTSTSVGREEMATMLAENPSQFIWTISTALSQITADDVIECGELGDDADAELVMFNLNMIAQAIARETIT